MPHYEIEARRGNSRSQRDNYYLVRVDVVDGVRQPRVVARIVPRETEDFVEFTRALAGLDADEE